MASVKVKFPAGQNAFSSIFGRSTETTTPEAPLAAVEGVAVLASDCEWDGWWLLLLGVGVLSTSVAASEGKRRSSGCNWKSFLSLSHQL